MKAMLKKSSLLISCLMLMVWGSFSSAIETVLIQNIEKNKSLGYQLQYFFDDSHELTLKKVLERKESEWTFSNKDELNFGFENPTLWIRFRLKNYSSQVQQKIIEIPQASMDEVDVFIIRVSGKQEKHQAGFRRLFNQRKIKTNNLLVPVMFAANETLDVYIKTFAEGPLSMPVKLWNLDDIFEHQQTLSLFSGLLFGALFIMLLYNVFVYLELRERSYLFLSFYIISLIMVEASFSGFGFQYLWSGNLWLEEKSYAISLGLLIVFASLFVESVIKVGKFLRGSLYATIIMGCFLTLVSLLAPYSFAIKATVPIVILSGFVAISVVIKVLLHGTRVTRYLVVGWSAFSIGFLLLFLTIFNVISNSFIFYHALEIAAVIEVLFLSLALIEKINQAKEQRDEALQNLLLIQQQTTNQLESRVKDRTSEIEEVMVKLEKANKLLKKLSFIDGLTRLNNRAYFDGTFEAQWKNSQRSQTAIALLFLDIDHFKRLNDVFGHLIGDQCLQTIAATIKEQVVRETDVVARYGGEEFVVLLPHTSVEDAELIAEKIRKAIARLEPVFNNQPVTMTISIGVAGLVPEQGKSSHDLIKLADLALYKAKKEGRNQVVVADDEMVKVLEELTK